MPIISVEIMKTINEKESCDTSCNEMKQQPSIIKTVKDPDNQSQK